MNAAINAALRLLTYRARSEQEVRRRLSRRFTADLVEGAIVALKKQAILDDVAFAISWRQSREQHKPRSISVVRWELLRMGVEREVVEQAIEGLDDEESAYQAARKILRRLQELDCSAFQKKLVAYLRRRGFGPEAIRITTRRLWEELSDPAYGYVKCDSHQEQPKDIAQSENRCQKATEHNE